MIDLSVIFFLNEGDVVLVYLIYINGWVDGILLLFGVRGWLLMNYCEVYEFDDMWNFFKVFLLFWDFL